MTTLHTIYGEIRGGGCGARAWVARITGTHEEYVFAREFVKKGGHTSRSGRSGTLEWVIYVPGVYEYRGIQHDSSRARIGQLAGGFICVSSDGSVSEITHADAVAWAKRAAAE